MASVTTSDPAVVAGALRSGTVVGVPTDTVYGIGVSLEHGRVADLVAAKRRPDGRPIAVLVASVSQAHALGVLDDPAMVLAARFWPGPLTLVVPRVDGFDSDLGGAPGTVGLRCPADPPLLELLASVGPLAVTSANLSGEPELHDAASIRDAFGEAVPVVWDGGRRRGTPSTVLNCSVSPAAVLRVGGISAATLASSGVTLA